MTAERSLEPLETLQCYLDRIGAAVMAGDYATYAAGVALPFHLITETASITVSSASSLREGFDSYRNMLESQGVTDYIRLAESAVQLGDRLVSGRYVTHVLRGAHRIVPPFKSQITLRQADGAWAAASISNSLKNPRWPIDLPRTGDATLPGQTPPKDAP